MHVCCAPQQLMHAEVQLTSHLAFLTGKLHFVNFETSHVEDAIDFIEAKGLHRHCSRNGTKEMRVKATGG